MRKPSGITRETNAWSKGGADSKKATTATETDALLSQHSAKSYSRTAASSNIRSRHSNRSPSGSISHHYGGSSSEKDMNTTYADDIPDKELQHAYNVLNDENLGSRSGNISVGDGSQKSYGSSHSGGSRSVHQLRRSYLAPKGSGENPPLLEIPEEIYGVRKSALKVLKPLTKTWLVVSIGFALTVLFGMARWTRLLAALPFWFILLPSWLSHVGLFWCHVLSAKALSNFIAGANDNRQRPDSRDHLDRTEYLPLLQRSLKFGLKTGLLSFGIFIFEILAYFGLSRGNLSLAVVLTPIWIMVIGGILDGIICKTQHFMRVICWILTFSSMVMACMKVDYGLDAVRWRMVVSPIVAVLSISSGTLIYIVYGHQIGYYRLTEAQLTAGNLYSLAALISIVLVVMVGEVMPQSRPVEIESRVFIVMMAPLVVALVGMGAWVVSRDEFGRLLLYGGQAAVHPKELRWAKNGWTSVQGKGVTNIPMFGEVSFCPLEKKNVGNINRWMYCTLYPPQEDDEDFAEHVDELNGHPYWGRTPSPEQSSQLAYMQWQQNATSNIQNI